MSEDVEAVEITDEAYRMAASRIHTREGECEIDSNAAVSRSSDGGAYVHAWVWVSDEDIEDVESER